MKMSEMTKEQLMEFVKEKSEISKKLVESNNEYKARIAGLENKVAELTDELATKNAAPADTGAPAIDPRVIWCDQAIADMIAEIHVANRSEDGSLIGLNSVEVDLTNKMIAIKRESPKPGLVKGVANKFLVEPLEAERDRVRADIEKETLKIANS